MAATGAVFPARATWIPIDAIAPSRNQPVIFARNAHIDLGDDATTHAKLQNPPHFHTNKKASPQRGF
jgi:hypothetical protein